MQKFFISYRREDSARWAEQIAIDLTRKIGASRVFFDRQSIQGGDDFDDAIDQFLIGDAVTLIAVIGPNWLDASIDGKSRLLDQNDRVRREIARADGAGAKIVPLLVDGAQMPSTSDLPHELAFICGRHAHEIDAESPNRDLARFIRTLAGPDLQLGEQPTGPPSRSVLNEKFGPRARWEIDVFRVDPPPWTHYAVVFLMLLLLISQLAQFLVFRQLLDDVTLQLKAVQKNTSIWPR